MVSDLNSERADIIQVRNLKKFFYGKKRLFQREPTVVKAVNDVSFSIRAGETFGIVGESGCGKSTLGRTVIQLLKPTDGQILYKGTDLSTLSADAMRDLRKEIQIIFQDPYASLNPKMTVRELIQGPLDVHSSESREKKLERVRNITFAVGLREEDLRKYPHEFSGGQRQRIVIARALILNPEFVFCDEPVSALDVSVRAQVLNLMKDIQEDLDLTYMFVSHDLSVVRFICDRVAVMYLGKIVEVADKHGLFDNAKHPYTEALLSAIPVPDVDVKRERILLEGDLPSSYDPPSGCQFHNRCRHATKYCELVEPTMKKVDEDHYVACHLFGNSDKMGNAS
ncbi:MAG TPA: peptide ABC transporter ATP-binding protein [Firmicutes bacterium]|jgi:peptide/nickel transport system ATP-binding protein/oligopeptide transport system ATP-binding protein|nr:peptide ABC transporter ATP-binding protein [Bacillota bacterium]